MVQICHIGSTPTVVPSEGTGPVPSENSATTSTTSSAAYSSDVDRAAGVALGQRYPVRPRWQPNGVGPQPVQDRSQRREEPVVQRAEPAAEADDLEQHGVEHDLLEHDRLGPPFADVGEPVHALGGQREQPAAEDVEQDLDDVEQVHHDRRAEAHLGPVPGHRPDLLGARALAPLGEVDDGHVGLEKSHGRKTRTCSRPVESVQRTGWPLGSAA